MKNFILNNALIITAIISLFGVSFAAILNYYCNIKINKMRIKHEKETTEQIFLQESFNHLRRALKELNEMRVIGNFEKTIFQIPEYNIRAKNIFISIKPFLSDSKRIRLEQEYEFVDSRNSYIQCKYYKDGQLQFEDITLEDLEIIKEITVSETQLRFQLARIIDGEISSLVNKLRKNQE